MSETLGKLRTFAGISGLAVMAVGCTVSIKSSDTAPPTVPLTPQAAYREAHCQNMTIRPGAKAGEFVLRIHGHAVVPADFGAIVVRDPHTTESHITAQVFERSTVAHDETVEGTLDLTASDSALHTYQITGVVTPTGYTGQIETATACQYTAAFAPRPAAARPS